MRVCVSLSLQSTVHGLNDRMTKVEINVNNVLKFASAAAKEAKGGEAPMRQTEKKVEDD